MCLTSGRVDTRWGPTPGSGRAVWPRSTAGGPLLEGECDVTVAGLYVCTVPVVVVYNVLLATLLVGVAMAGMYV